MEIKVNFLENRRLEAKFDDFSVISDQPVRYKGDGSAPGPYDYFLASSAMCAAHFIRVYCLARDIPTEKIRLSQNNIVDPEDRYSQIFRIQVELPEDLSEKDRKGILRSAERCTVKRVVQNDPSFEIEAVDNLDEDAQALLTIQPDGTRTRIPGKDRPQEDTIANVTGMLEKLGMQIEVGSWRNIVPNVWSLHIRDAASPMCFTNGKGATKESALCSALGEFIERLSCNFFYNECFWGEAIANGDFVHYPDERWFPLQADDGLPEGLMDEHCRSIYDPDGELCGSHLIDTNSGRRDRGIVALPYERHSDGEVVYFPSNLIENLFLSNGMSAGNTWPEAQVQCLSEILERAVKKEIIEGEMALPEVPQATLAKYPAIQEGIEALEAHGFPVVVRDASLGGRYPVASVTVMNPQTCGVFACFGAHPSFELALERSLTELLQGRSLEGLNDLPLPTFDSMVVTEPNNFVEHFIDSSGIMSWRFFSTQPDYEFCEWDFSAGTTEAEAERLYAILRELGKEVYVSRREELGLPVCRILVPDYSEIYPVEDLVWDNTNMALDFREDILNLHRLDNEQLRALVQRLDDSDIDVYTSISTLIGVVFDDYSVWGQLTVLELKLLVHLALQEHAEALDLVEMFLQYNDNHVTRNLFFRAVQAVLEITLDDGLALADYRYNLGRMFGDEAMEAAVGSVDGSVRFHGLTPTNMQLEGLEKHERMLQSYRKLHAARAAISQGSARAPQH